jgi:hypothetical protein
MLGGGAERSGGVTEDSGEFGGSDRAYIGPDFAI